MDAPTSKESGHDLAREVLAGTEGAFARLLEEYQPRVFRLVHGILGDWQRSEDVCQEVFVKVHLKLPEFRFGSRLSTWVWRIAVNAALRARKAASRATSMPLPEGEAGPSREDDARQKIEGRELLEKILRPLEPRHRAVVILREREGLSYRELAEVLGCSRGAVEQRLHRAYVRLREIWAGRERELGWEEGP